ncbi:hypothetical protein F4782DRAFT_550341 [Xylaria castorea]|nr:hypothetical protein F4782DRAFT_550341 [Xylaria castorea]
MDQDPRESVPAISQAWTTLVQAQTSGKFKNTIRQQYPDEPHIYTIQTQSILGIGQRCFLIRTPKWNILWGCLAYIDDATVKEVASLVPRRCARSQPSNPAKLNTLDGVDAISISHPHFQTSHLTWSRALNNAPIFLSTG